MSAYPAIFAKADDDIAADKKGPAEVAASPSHGLKLPSKGNPDMDRNTTSALQRAMGSLALAENYIHAAWMAARSMDGDESPAGEALQVVIHMAGETLGDVRNALRKAGAE